VPNGFAMFSQGQQENWNHWTFCCAHLLRHSLFVIHISQRLAAFDAINARIAQQNHGFGSSDRIGKAEEDGQSRDVRSSEWSGILRSCGAVGLRPEEMNFSGVRGNENRKSRKRTASGLPELHVYQSTNSLTSDLWYEFSTEQSS
jgi:hypothetical protein